MRKAAIALVVLAGLLGACTSSKTAAPQPSSGAGIVESSDWCKLARDYNNQSSAIADSFKNIDKDPAKAKQQLANAYRGLRLKFKALFDKAAQVAPAEIRSDLKLLGDALNSFMDALAAADYDLQKMAQNYSKVLQTTFTDPKFIKASTNVGEYDAKHCGIPFTPPASSK